MALSVVYFLKILKSRVFMHLPLVNNFMGSRVPQFKVLRTFFSPPSARELRQSQNHVESIKTSMKSHCDEKAKRFCCRTLLFGG